MKIQQPLDNTYDKTSQTSQCECIGSDHKDLTYKTQMESASEGQEVEGKEWA